MKMEGMKGCPAGKIYISRLSGEYFLCEEWGRRLVGKPIVCVWGGGVQVCAYVYLANHKSKQILHVFMLISCLPTLMLKY